jgi:hypothetical protein
VFCIYLRTNSDLCHLQHKLIGFDNRDEMCLQRGMDWVFKYAGGLPHRVTNTSCCIDTVISPNDGHIVARNMYRIEINIEEKLCTKLVLFTRL